MSKTLKRTLAIVMAIAMIFSLSATAFADNDQYSVTAYVRLQTATAPSDWDLTLGDLNVTNYLTGTAATNYFVPVTVSQDTPITVKDIVEALNGFSLVTCTNHDSHGCIHSDTVESGETACTCSTCDCTWKRVKNMVWDPVQQAYLWDNTYASAMNSLRYNNVTRTNNSFINTEDYEEGHGYYEGTSWEYFVGNNDSASAIYSVTQYMDQYVVSSSVYITLSFDTSSFEW